MAESRFAESARRMARGFAGGPGVVYALLLILLALRAWNLNLQDAYLDEGFHIRRAMDLWGLDENPGRFAHGKILLYFWLAPAANLASQAMVLWACRLSMALFAMVTGAAIYSIGRRLSDHATGVVALAIYAVLPLAVYFERMAMADPLASGLTALLVLALLSLVRHPTWKGALAAGALTAAATMAKMTVALVVLLPALVAIDLYDWRRIGFGRQARAFLGRYIPWVVLVWLAVACIWSPILVPAFRAAGSDEPFLLFHHDNIVGEKGDSTLPTISRAATYGSRLFPLVAEFTSVGFLLVAIAAIFVGLLWKKIDDRSVRGVLVLVQWIAVIAFPTWLLAAITTARYFVPVLPPLCLLIALVVVTAWRWAEPKVPLRAALVAAGAAWLIFHTGPFLATALTDPYELPFSGTNYGENIAGYFQSDDAVRAAAATLNEISPSTVYATWNLCHLIFYDLDTRPVCFARDRVGSELGAAIDAIPPGEALYVAFADYGPFYESFDRVDSEIVASFDRARIDRPVQVIAFRRSGD